MILSAAFFAAVAAFGLVLFLAIVKSAIDDARASSVPVRAGTASRVIVPGADREGRFVREGERAAAPVGRDARSR